MFQFETKFIKSSLWVLLLFVLASCSGFKPQPQKKRLFNAETALSTIAISSQEMELLCNDNELCKCNFINNRILSGEPYDDYTLYTAEGPNDPAVVFQGGSENIAMTCRTGRYLLENNPIWLEQFFEVQKRPEIGFLGSELFSSIYTATIAGSAVTVLNHARKNNHPRLAQLAAEWLKAYWSYLTLSAHYEPVSEFQYTSDGNAVSSDQGMRNTYGLTIPGTRSYVDQGNATGLQPVLLSVALEAPYREYGIDLDTSPGYYGGVAMLLRSVGYSASYNQRVYLRNMSIPAEKLGLTESERSLLNEYIHSRGNTGLKGVLQLIGNYQKLRCNLTFIRNENGVLAWFGRSDNISSDCFGSKGGSQMAIGMNYSDRIGHVLYRVEYENTPEPSRTWREGDSICGDSTLLPKACISIPNGAPISEVTFEASLGIKCVMGNCSTNNPPAPAPEPTPPPTTPPAPGPNPPHPELPDPIDAATANCSTQALCLINQRFKITASWYSQYDGHSDNAKPISGNDLVGYFHFGDPSNYELAIKILDFGTSFQLYYAQLTTFYYKIHVYDTITHTSKFYSNTPGNCGGYEVNLFNASSSSSLTSISSSITSSGNENVSLLSGRMSISGWWRNPWDNSTGTIKGHAITAYTAGLYFSDPRNIEVYFKALDFGDKIFVALGSLTPFEYELTVRDTVTGIQKVFRNEPGAYCGSVDATTFRK